MTNDPSARNRGSFRDPSGYIFEQDGKILRTVRTPAAEDFAAARESGVLDGLIKGGKLVPFTEIDQANLPEAQSDPDVIHLLEHPRLPFISYPYEWSFPMLRDAALLHLEIQLELLEKGFVLSDASAYNIQFQNAKPIFIDHLSVRPYKDGEFWSGHKQFCEQFLNPLLLTSLFGIAHNAWYRGNQEGIPVADLARMLRLRHKLSWTLFTHVVMQARLQSGAAEKQDLAKLRERRLPKHAYKGLLTQLRGMIGKLRPSGRRGDTTWGNYATDNTYSSDEATAKRQFIMDFVTRNKPASVVDLGCNTGDYSKACLESGAERVLGFDFDQGALEQAYFRARQEKLNYLPLFLDASNPSPDQGWAQRERPGFATRVKADGVLALAFEHHLAIAKNIPLPEAVSWLMDVAPRGVIEFVPKGDPTVVKMLELREDIFPHYTEEAFAEALSARGEIVRREVVSKSGRVLFEYRRHDAKSTA